MNQSKIKPDMADSESVRENEEVPAKGKSKKKKGSKKWKTPVKCGDYTMVCQAQEDHKRPIYGCQFHWGLGEETGPAIFAAVGCRVSIYECAPNGHLKVLLIFADPDPEEEFYCCAWTDNGAHLLAAAGLRGVIRIFSLAEGYVKHFIGHGDTINHLTFHPTDPNLLLSASKDLSLRLWNIKTDICIAIFADLMGFREPILHADFKMDGSRIICCGMEHAFRIWRLDKPKLVEAVKLSYVFPDKRKHTDKPFPTVKDVFPEFKTVAVHLNYVDCVQWHGDFIYSKGCDNRLVSWKVGKLSETWEDIHVDEYTKPTILREYALQDCGLWFMKFSMDKKHENLAVGNSKGSLFVYDLKDPANVKITTLTHPRCCDTIRQTTFSPDGKILICVCDDGTIWRWDLNFTNANPSF